MIGINNLTTIPFPGPKPQTQIPTQLKTDRLQKTEHILHKFIDIKPITITEEDILKLERLIRIYSKRYQKFDFSAGIGEDTIKQIKYNFLAKVVKICGRCSNLAEYQVNYDCSGATLIQRYCGKCLEEEKKKGNIERDY
jgi:hypothetical protein